MMRHLQRVIISVLMILLAGSLPLSVPANAQETAKTPTVKTLKGAGKPVTKRVVAVAARVAGDDTRTRFIADLDAVVDVNAFALADPYRVVVDMPETEFRFSPEKGEQGRGLIAAYRYGLFAKGKSRIVLDVRGPVRIDRAFVLDPSEGQPARLVIDIVRIDRKDFFENIGIEVPVAPVARAKKGDRKPVPAKKAPRTKPLIVLDPGHGGIDSGAVGRGRVKEKDVVLAFGLALRDTLLKSGRYDVKMTRSDDTFLKLTDRVAFARAHEADLFISLHADSLKARGVRGASIYTLSETASDAQTASLSYNENRADLVAGLKLPDESEDVTDILIQLTRRETKGFSVNFADTFVGSVSKVTKMIRNPHRYDAFIVLKAPDVPSVLVELGFMSNRNDEKLLVSPAWREKTAAAIGRAVDLYFTRRRAAK